MQLGRALPQGHNASTVDCAELECVSVQLLRRCSFAELASHAAGALGEERMNKMEGKKAILKVMLDCFILLHKVETRLHICCGCFDRRGGRPHGPGLPSTEQLLKAWLHHLQVIRLDLLRKALDVQDGLVSLVEQLLADLLLHPVSPGAQLREALEHIQARPNRLRIRIRLTLTCT